MRQYGIADWPGPILITHCAAIAIENLGYPRDIARVDP